MTFVRVIALGENPETGEKTQVPVLVNTTEISRVEWTPDGVKVVLFREGVSFLVVETFDDISRQLLPDPEKPTRTFEKGHP